MAKILLVEDNEDNGSMLSRWLVRRGHEVVIVVDGEAALAAVPDGEFDIILMDLTLPGIDGWEVTRRLKDDPATASAWVIALTAHAMNDDRKEALCAGFNDFDTKPVELTRLLYKIEAGVAGRVAA